jgi:metal-dependent amidase/aminoacylase/carboxypeptidase family protein
MNPKEAAKRRIDRARDRVVALSHRIHRHPELGGEEVRACAWVCDELSTQFEVTRGICDLPTAFVARTGRGPLHVAICAEYDSLPGSGHACGHNLIAAMAAGAGFALAKLADDLGISLSVIGTPAEEAGSGKILLLERGGFDGVHAAMMVHPAPLDDVTPRLIAAPRGDRSYAEMVHDPYLAETYRRNAVVLGRKFRDRPGGPRPAWPFAPSSDMGNVSAKIPSIHPHIGIDSLPAINHEPEFAAACATSSADQAIVDGSLAMAFTAIDIALDQVIRRRLLSGPRAL